MLSWQHSGFSIDNSVRIAPNDQKGQIRLAQYIIRNTFSLDKLLYNEENGTVIYHSKITHGTSKKNFEVYTVEEFIAAVTQHIPDKSYQMVRYYGYYSSKSRGIRCKQGIFRPGDEIAEEITRNAEIINVSEYKPCRIPSKTWRECIKKIWNQDPLCCPHCGSAMKIISFITLLESIQKILKHLGLWNLTTSRDPPVVISDETIIYEPLYDDVLADYDVPNVSID